MSSVKQETQDLGTMISVKQEPQDLGTMISVKQEPQETHPIKVEVKTEDDASGCSNVKSKNKKKKEVPNDGLSKRCRKHLYKKLDKGVAYDVAYQSALRLMARKAEKVKRIQNRTNAKKLRKLALRNSREGLLTKVNKRNPIRVGVILSDPDNTMNFRELKQLETTIFELIRDEVDGAYRVRFEECINRTGWLQIKCADGYSVDWLRRQLPHLKLWEWADFKLIQGEELSRYQAYQERNSRNH